MYTQKLPLWWSVWLRWQIGWDWMQWVYFFELLFLLFTSRDKTFAIFSLSLSSFPHKQRNQLPLRFPPSFLDKRTSTCYYNIPSSCNPNPAHFARNFFHHKTWRVSQSFLDSPETILGTNSSFSVLSIPTLGMCEVFYSCSLILIPSFLFDHPSFFLVMNVPRSQFVSPARSISDNCIVSDWISGGNRRGNNRFELQCRWKSDPGH